MLRRMRMEEEGLTAAQAARPCPDWHTLDPASLRRLRRHAKVNACSCGGLRRVALQALFKPAAVDGMGTKPGKASIRCSQARTWG